LTGSTGKTVIQVLFGFLILSVFFWLMESLWPEERQQPKFRRGMFTDTLYFFFIIPATKIIATIGLIIGIYMTSRLLPHTGIFLTNIQSQPIWAQTIEVLFLGDLLGYWMHRIFHRTGILWPIHAIHHSSEQVDWLSSVRVHPLDTLFHDYLSSFHYISLASRELYWHLIRRFSQYMRFTSMQMSLGIMAFSAMLLLVQLFIAGTIQPKRRHSMQTLVVCCRSLI